MKDLKNRWTAFITHIEHSFR